MAPGDLQETPRGPGKPGCPGRDHPYRMPAATLAKAKQEQAHGEIDSKHPGYLGPIKRVGRIYQRTFNDTYSRLAAAKLY